MIIFHLSSIHLLPWNNHTNIPPFSLSLKKQNSMARRIKVTIKDDYFSSFQYLPVVVHKSLQ